MAAMYSPTIATSTGPARTEYPMWVICGPGSAALAGAFLFTADIGRTGSTVLAELGSPESSRVVWFAGCLVAGAVGLGVGVLARRFPTVVAVGAIFAMVIGAVAMGFASNGNLYLVGKVVAGLGVGAAWGVSVFVALSTGERKRMAIALLAGLGVVSAIAGPLVTGAITTLFSWRVGYLAVILVLGMTLIVTAVIGVVRYLAPKGVGGGPV